MDLRCCRKHSSGWYAQPSENCAAVAASRDSLRLSLADRQRRSRLVPCHDSMTGTSPAIGKNVFASERHLVDGLLRVLPCFFGEGAVNWRCAIEVGVGAVIADVVAVCWSGSIRMPTRALTARESVVLSVLRQGGPQRVEVLEQRCGLARGALRRTNFDDWVEDGFLERRPGGVLAAKTQWISRARVIAFEAKLGEWRQAIRQANSYATYADKAYVAMPRGKVRQHWFAHFRSENVGLLDVGTNDVATRVEAGRRRVHDWRREFVLSRVLARGEVGGASGAGSA